MRSIDWKTLERLRVAFLTGTTDYWHDECDLENYDATFAQRIAWKWDYVLSEAKRRGWSPPTGTVLDWGCGTGIASRKFLECFTGVRRLYLCDRSPLAMKFAAQRVRDVEVWQESVPPRSVDVLLISHALTEQPAPFALPCEAKTVLIVEPGTYEVSRRLIALREHLRGEFNVVAPCTHQAVCGMLAAENERHWCHHFAPTPTAVFMDGNWARFAKLAGIDLRSLPVSYLVLDRRPVESGGMRVIGRPRVYKAHALVLGCNATGVRERRLEKRTEPDLYRKLKKGMADTLWLETKAP
jgi:SAM-dependent methyltransferase